MVTFYRVMPLSWHAGRPLVKAPFLTMVNLVAGRLVVPELIQNEMTPGRLAQTAARLLADESAMARMRNDLNGVRASLTKEGDPFAVVADSILQSWQPRAGTEKVDVLTSGRK
jgi:lipid-A-disaccharide synthase